ncbi:MAG: DUF885 domain-containing protein [Candidatus Eremiobacteraeota bacterium]|nr:DUF885 domain-containing protein [Candidatus Eremiobacteraeota bacterium]
MSPRAARTFIVSFCLISLLICITSGRTSRAALAPAAHATDASYDALQGLARDVTFVWAKRHPLVATAEGISSEDGLLDTPSAAEDDGDLALVRAWEKRLAAIPIGGEPRKVRDDAALLRAELLALERQYTVYRTDRKDYSAPGVAIVNAVYTQFLHVPLGGRAGSTTADVRSAWRDITARLQRAPAYIAAGEKLVTEPGHLQAAVGADELASAPEFLTGALSDAAKAQLTPSAFRQFVSARNSTLRSLAQEKSYIDTHIASWPENFAMGRQAYNRMIQDEQLVPFDSESVARMGEDELAHGWAETYWIEHLARERHTTIGAASGGGLAPAGAALLPYYREQIATLQHFVKAHQVMHVPSWLGRIDVIETPKFLQPVSPGASMQSPRLFSQETNGFYFITPPTSLAAAAARLDANEDFDRDRILSTAAHEAMPGHFLQLSIARRNPDFIRKIQSSGSFAEGWAYYGEEMFVRLGLYGDDLDARYYTAQWERVRGARAIVDAKLAAREMTEPQAVAYFAEHTGFTKQAAKEAVDGIALSPGYVIAYTVGRQQLELLEHDYFAIVGPRGSLQDFHDRLMCYGTTPLAIVAPELLNDLSKPLRTVQTAANAL